MPEGSPILLFGGRVRAWVRASEGGVVDALLVDGRPALARTPWADDVVPGSDAAVSEADWVARWRGGWQLCFPSTGRPDSGGATPHGAGTGAGAGIVTLDPGARMDWRTALAVRWMAA